MPAFTEVYNSYFPIYCHVIKGLLESNGIKAFVFDENMVYVNPFSGLSIGGVKVMVGTNQADKARQFLEDQKQKSAAEIRLEIDTDFERKQQVLLLQSQIRQDPTCLDNKNEIECDVLSSDELEILLDGEFEYQRIKNRNIEHFLPRVLAKTMVKIFEHEPIWFLLGRPHSFHLERDVIEIFEQADNRESEFECPNCGSRNLYYGHTTNMSWGIWYFVLCIAFVAPFPPFTKSYRCFSCDSEFTRKEITDSRPKILD